MVEFASRYNTLTLTMSPPRKEYRGNERVFIPGRVIKFENGVYRTNDPEEIEFLRNHRWYGSSKLIEVTEGDKAAANVAAGIIELSCDYEGCNYVAKGKTTQEALRKLNMHKTRMAHHRTESPSESDDEDLEE